MVALCVHEAWAHMSFVATGHRGNIATGSWLKVFLDSESRHPLPVLPFHASWVAMHEVFRLTRRIRFFVARGAGKDTMSHALLATTSPVPALSVAHTVLFGWHTAKAADSVLIAGAAAAALPNYDIVRTGPGLAHAAILSDSIVHYVCPSNRGDGYV